MIDKQNKLDDKITKKFLITISCDLPMSHTSNHTGPARLLLLAILFHMAVLQRIFMFSVIRHPSVGQLEKR